MTEIINFELLDLLIPRRKYVSIISKMTNTSETSFNLNDEYLILHLTKDEKWFLVKKSEYKRNEVFSGQFVTQIKNYERK